MKKQRRKLKNYWIDSGFQSRYILTMLGSSLFCLSISGFVVWTFFNENYKTIVDLISASEEAFFKMQIELKILIFNLVLTGFAFLVSISAIGLFYSHKTAGPMYKVKQVANAILSGDVNTRIKLRPGDDFKDVAELLNSAFDKIKNPDENSMQF